MPAVTIGWACTATDRITNIAVRETSTSVSAVTFTWGSAPTNSDVIQHQCTAYSTFTASKSVTSSLPW